MTKSMKRMQRVERMSFSQLSKNEQIALYLHDHPLSQKLMLYIATHYMNIGYIRKRIKELYPKIVMNNIQDNNFVLIPEHYVQNKE
jgi:hypothetical protein